MSHASKAKAVVAVQPKPDTLLDLLLRDVQRERLLVLTNGTPDELLALVMLASEMHTFKRVDIVVSGLCDCFFPTAIAAVHAIARKHCKLPPNRLHIVAGLTKLCVANGRCGQNFDRYAGDMPPATRESELHEELKTHEITYSLALVLGDYAAGIRMSNATAQCKTSRIPTTAFEGCVCVIMYHNRHVAAAPARWTTGRKRIYTFSSAHAIGDVDLSVRMDEVAASVRETYPLLWPDSPGWPTHGLCQTSNTNYYAGGVCMLAATLNMTASQVPHHLAQCFGSGPVGTYYFSREENDPEVRTDAAWSLLFDVHSSVGNPVAVWRE